MSEQVFGPERRTSLCARLREIAAEVEADLALSEGEDRPVALDQPIGRLSRMEAIQQQQMTAATRQRQRKRLLMVRAAQTRLAQDPEAFGYCLRCDEMIAWRRLEARPESTLCLDCQSHVEAR